MALKITTQIGTNRGLTSEAYVRLKNYDLQKSGKLALGIQVYQNESDANQPLGETPLYKEAVSLEIGSVLNVPLLKDATILVTKPTLVDELQTISVPKYDANGVPTDPEERQVTIKVMKDIETEEVIQVPDMSILEGKDVFVFGYAKLKEKLVGLFGAENVVDC